MRMRCMEWYMRCNRATSVGALWAKVSSGSGGDVVAGRDDRAGSRRRRRAQWRGPGGHLAQVGGRPQGGEDALDAGERPPARHDRDGGEGDDLEVERRRRVVEVEEGETALPGPDDLVVEEVRVLRALEDVPLVGEDDGGEIRDARPHPEEPPLLGGVDGGLA